MLPGRTPEQKKNLARKLREALSVELGVDKLIVSVSIEDVDLSNWEGFMQRIPDHSIIIPEENKDDENSKKCNCCCC